MKVALRRFIYAAIRPIARFDRRKSEVIVLCYHGFSDDTWRFNTKVSEFEKQIGYLKQNFQIISPADFEAYLAGKKTFEKPAVLLTIDDGYADVLNIQAMLKKYHIRPILFVLSDTQRVKREEIGTNKEFLSPAEVKDLIADGWIIGSHTATHPNLQALDKQSLEAEIRGSKQDLESMYGQPTTAIAYPKGKYTSEVLRAVADAGYTLAFTMDDSHIAQANDRYRIPRIGVDGTHTMAEFPALMSPLAIDFRKFVKRYFPALAL